MVEGNGETSAMQLGVWPKGSPRGPMVLSEDCKTKQMKCGDAQGYQRHEVEKRN